MHLLTLKGDSISFSLSLRVVELSSFLRITLMPPPLPPLPTLLVLLLAEELQFCAEIVLVLINAQRARERASRVHHQKREQNF